MRKDAIEIIANYLFTGEEGQNKLEQRDREMLERIETCYTQWLDNPMWSDIQMRNFLMHRFNLIRMTALNVISYTTYALGNVNSASKSFVRKKIDYLLTKATSAAENGDLKYAQTLTKIALAYGKSFDTGTDDIDLSEIRQNFTIDKVVIVNDPKALGVKITGREREETLKILEKYNISQDEVLYEDVEYQEVGNGD